MTSSEVKSTLNLMKEIYLTSQDLSTSLQECAHQNNLLSRKLHCKLMLLLEKSNTLKSNVLMLIVMNLELAVM